MLSPDLNMYVLPGGVIPKRMTDQAVGFDIGIRALVSFDEIVSETPRIQKTIFDFKKFPTDPALAAHVIRENNGRGKKPALAYVLSPGESVHAGAGFILEMPFPLFYVFLDKSGLKNKKGIQIMNTAIPIDPDHRGEVVLTIKNIGEQPFVLRHNMRMAQMIFTGAVIPNFVRKRHHRYLSKTKRGGKGLGSTGLL